MTLLGVDFQKLIDIFYYVFPLAELGIMYGKLILSILIVR